MKQTKNDIMKSVVTNLSAEKLEAMFNLCWEFQIPIEYEGIQISDCNHDEMMVKKVDAKYYEEPIRTAFHKYVEMYAKQITI